MESEAAQLRPASTGLAATDLGCYRDQLLAMTQQRDYQLIVGASMGAVLAWQLATKLSPSAALVLINPPLPDPGAAASEAIIRWRGNQSLESTRRHLRGCTEVDCYYAHHRWRDESGLALAQARAWKPARIANPCLLVLGSADPAAELDGGKELAQALGATRWSIDGAGHLQPLFGDAAIELVQRLISWSATAVGR